MEENGLQNNISNLYLKFFESDKNTQPYCQCGNSINTNLLKMGMKIINYGICKRCNKVSFFTEYNEFKQGNYQQILKKMSDREIITELEQFIDENITERDVQYYSSKFVAILTKIQTIESERNLLKASFLKDGSKIN